MRQIIERTKSRVSLPLGHMIVRPQVDDQYIVAFPRSGSTWLRTILANILVSDANSSPDVFNTLIPGVSIRNAFMINRLKSPRIIFSHTQFRRGLPRVVYMVRDGRDAFISYYYYLVKRRDNTTTDIQRFFAQYRAGKIPPTWHEHVISWLQDGRQTMGDDSLKIIYFEELKQNPINVVKEVVEFLRIDADLERIESAVANAGLENVRKLEKSRWLEKGMGKPNHETSFYRKGGSEQWKESLPEEILQEFEQISAKALQLAKYPLYQVQ